MQGTGADVGVARPLIEGLSTETVVTDPSGSSLFDVEPRPFHEVLADAVAQETRPGGERLSPDSAATRKRV